MKKIIFVFFILVSSMGYSKTIWSGNNYDKNLVVLYKVLDPLIVTVDKPQKIVIPAIQKTYKYSEYSQGNRKLQVKVETPFNKGMIDDILRKVYEKVYFKLQNEGNFDLNYTGKKDKETENTVIKGKGYFVDNKVGATENLKKVQIEKDFASTVNSEQNKFSTTTEIDAEFTIDKENIPMGVYTGTLKLDVWFGGSVK